jgi:hypothetical protein
MLYKKGAECPTKSLAIIKFAENLLSKNCPEFTMDVLKQNFERNIIEKVRSSFAGGASKESYEQKLNVKRFTVWFISKSMIPPAGIIKI